MRSQKQEASGEAHPGEDPEEMGRIAVIQRGGSHSSSAGEVQPLAGSDSRECSDSIRSDHKVRSDDSGI